MAPMKILHTNMHLKWGGQPNRVLTTAIGLASLGHEVTVCGPRGAMLVERARAKGLDTFDDLELKRGFRPLSICRDVFAMRAHLDAQHYDIVDTHGSQDSWVVRYALAGRSQRPAVIRSRHNIFKVSSNPANRWLYRQVDHAITISPQVIPLLSGVIPVERCTSIYSAPDPARFAIPNAREETRQELGIADTEFVIGVVGRLAPEKGHRFLIAAAPEILGGNPAVRFLFVGTGRSRPELEAQIAALGLQDRFILTGFREDVPRMLHAMDLFVLCPTDGESLGTSILEAFLCECPVVATDVGGVCESVLDGKTGRLIPPGDSAALAEAVRWILADPVRARSLALAGKARVQEFFTPERIARETEAVYRQVLERRKGSP